MAKGFTFPVGNDPALNTSKRGPPSRFNRYSPKMLRAELPVQRNKSLYCLLSIFYYFSRAGINQRSKTVAVTPPASWAKTKPGVSTGRIPAKVSLKERASVTAGFANDVDAVNQ